MGQKETQSDVVDHDFPLEDHVPQGSTLPFWKQTELRKLYGMMFFLFLGSTTLGYDGSLLNGLQTMDSWQNCTCFDYNDDLWLMLK
jgi:hypothetical protein